MKHINSCLGGIIWIGGMDGRLWLRRGIDAVETFWEHVSCAMRAGELEKRIRMVVAWRCHLSGLLIYAVVLSEACPNRYPCVILFVIRQRVSMFMTYEIKNIGGWEWTIRTLSSGMAASEFCG